MKIGYVRMNMPLDLDFFKASPTALGTELRLGIIDAMVQQGHEVTILSPVKKSHLHILKGEKTKEFDYSCFKKVKYDHTGYPKQDVLFIEKSVPNTMFRYKVNGKDIPFVWRTFQLINKHKGHVVYFQEEAAGQSFPFAVQHQELGKGRSEWNLRVMGKKVDFWKDKTWTILTHYKHHKKWIKSINENRFCYNKYIRTHGLKSKQIPVCYSAKFDRRFLPKKNPQYKLLYIGNDRDKNRKMKMYKFYDGHKFRSNVFGKWKPENVKMFETTDFMGFCSPGLVTETYNNSYATVQIADREYEEYGLTTNRIVQVIRGGSICFCDKDIQGSQDYFDDYFLVNSREDLRKKLEEVQNMSYEERKTLNEEQHSKLQTWDSINWEEVLTDKSVISQEGFKKYLEEQESNNENLL